MSIKLLRTLVAVADAKTFGAAAHKVHVTHAAVSQHMRALEADLGVKLFDRSRRTPELTPVAIQVVAKARKLIDDYDSLIPSVLSDGGLSGHLTFGAMPTTLTGLTPRAAAVLRQTAPQIRLHIRPGLTRALLTDVERRVLDVALVSKPSRLSSGLVFQSLVEEPMELIAGFDMPIDDPDALLATQPFIRFDRNAVVGGLIEDWMLARGLSVMETMELDSLEAINSMVHANLGVSIVPKRAVSSIADPAVRRYDLGQDAPVRILGLVHRKDHIKAQAIRVLFDALAQVIAEATQSDAP